MSILVLNYYGTLFASQACRLRGFQSFIFLRPVHQEVSLSIGVIGRVAYHGVLNLQSAGESLAIQSFMVIQCFKKLFKPQVVNFFCSVAEMGFTPLTLSCGEDSLRPDLKLTP